MQASLSELYDLNNDVIAESSRTTRKLAEQDDLNNDAIAEKDDLNNDAMAESSRTARKLTEEHCEKDWDQDWVALD